MIIDTAVKDFLEKYDREAMVSIDKFSSDETLIKNRYKVNLFNITESFKRVNQLINNWENYNLSKVSDSKTYTFQEAAKDVSNLINTDLIKDQDYFVQDVSSFVESYLTGVKELSSTIDKVKTNLIKNNVQGEKIGIINQFADTFMEKVNAEFYKKMDSILWETGYNSRIEVIKSPLKPKKENIII